MRNVSFIQRLVNVAIGMHLSLDIHLASARNYVEPGKMILNMKLRRPMQTLEIKDESRMRKSLDDRDMTRTAIHDRIIALLQIFRRWEPEVEDHFNLYVRMGGYYDREYFEREARK